MIGKVKKITRDNLILISDNEYTLDIRKSLYIAEQAEYSTKASLSNTKAKVTTSRAIVKLSNTKITSANIKLATKRQSSAPTSSVNKRQKINTTLIKQENVVYIIRKLSESDNNSELKILRVENKALKDKAKANLITKEKLRASDIKFILLAKTTALVYTTINLLLTRIYKGINLLKKVYILIIDNKLKEDVRQFYKEYTTVIKDITTESQDKVNQVLSTYFDLIILF